MNTSMQSFIQSVAWEELQKKYGNTVFRLESALFIEHKIGPLNYAISSRCQSDFLSSLTRLHHKSYSFLRLEPIDETAYKAISKYSEKQHQKLIKQPSVNPKQTLVIDLSLGYDQILASMKPKHRYNIRLAEKKGLTCQIVSTDLAAHFARFWQLHQSTANRQEFHTHPRDYILNMLQTLENHQMAHLLFVRHETEGDLATMILITDPESKTATYLHGGSSKKHKNLMAPFLLHQEAMKFSITKGMMQYDFWGTDAIYQESTKTWEAQANKGSYGTTRFKLGFGGNIINYPGTYDLVLKPFCYIGYSLLRNIRRRKRDFA